VTETPTPQPGPEPGPDTDEAFAEIVAAELAAGAGHDAPAHGKPAQPAARDEPPAHRTAPTPGQDGHTPGPPAPSAPRAEGLLPRQPQMPDYWGRHGLAFVYWIAIATGAVGQIAFFGAAFRLGIAGYVAAAVVATTAETIMVAAGDNALHWRALGRRRTQWVPFLAVAAISATAASYMNVSHWWADSTSMAVLFGGISFLGWVLHVLHGYGDGTQYLDDKARREAAEAELAAAHQPAQPAAAAEARPAKPRPAKSAGKVPAKRVGKPELTAAEARAYAQQHPGATASQVRAHFAGQGHQVPTERTVRRWISP
jgi:hypothetical protein